MIRAIAFDLFMIVLYLPTTAYMKQVLQIQGQWGGLIQVDYLWYALAIIRMSNKHCGISSFAFQTGFLDHGFRDRALKEKLWERSKDFDNKNLGTGWIQADMFE